MENLANQESIKGGSLFPWVRHGMARSKVSLLRTDPGLLGLYGSVACSRNSEDVKREV